MILLQCSWRGSVSSVSTEFYVLVGIVIEIISKMKKRGPASRDRDQDRTYKSGSEKRKPKQAENEMFKKHTKSKRFLKSVTGKVNKEQELVKERIEEEVGASVKKKSMSAKKGNIFDLFNLCMCQLLKMYHCAAL